jgi:hypothetical protein
VSESGAFLKGDYSLRNRILARYGEREKEKPEGVCQCFRRWSFSVRRRSLTVFSGDGKLSVNKGFSLMTMVLQNTLIGLTSHFIE